MQGRNSSQLLRLTLFQATILGLACFAASHNSSLALSPIVSHLASPLYILLICLCFYYSVALLGLPNDSSPAHNPHRYQCGQWSALLGTPPYQRENSRNQTTADRQKYRARHISGIFYLFDSYIYLAYVTKTYTSSSHIVRELYSSQLKPLCAGIRMTLSVRAAGCLIKLFYFLRSRKYTANNMKFSRYSLYCTRALKQLVCQIVAMKCQSLIQPFYLTNKCSFYGMLQHKTIGVNYA